MISVLHSGKPSPDSGGLQNGITKRLAVSSRNPRTRGSTLQEVRFSLPQVFSAAKLKNQPSKKDEGILEKYSNPRVYYGLLFSDETSKEDPHGCDQRAKGQHETNEEPDPGTCLTQTTFTVTITSDLSIRYRINH